MSSRAYDSLMRHDAAWYARISLILSGALRIWGVHGAVARDPGDAGGFVLSPANGCELRITHRQAAGWLISLRDPAAGVEQPLSAHAGLPGLLRRLREEMVPDAPAGRLIIGGR